MKKIISSFIFIILFTSCFYNKKGNIEQEKISFSELNWGDSLGRVRTIKSQSNYLIVCEKNSDTQLAFINMNTRKIQRYGNTGQGPNDYLSAWNILFKRNKIMIFDVGNKIIKQYLINDKKEIISESLNTIKIQEPHILEIECLNDSNYIGLGLLDKDQFAIINAQGAVINKGGKLPQKEKENILDIVHSMANQSIITAKNNRSAIATRYAESINFYMINNNDFNLLHSHCKSTVKYEQIGNEKNASFRFTPETQWGYMSIDSDENYVYALFSGNKTSTSDSYYGSKIQIFDWNGSIIKELLFPNRLISICINNNILYGYDIDKEDIVSSKLSKYFQ